MTVGAAVDRCIEVVLAALMVAMTVIVFTGVFFRYVVASPLGWTEEAGRFCLMWASLLGMYLAYRRAEHIRVDALTSRLNPLARHRLLLAGNALLAVYIAALVLEGFRYCSAFLDSYSPMLDLPLGVVYAALPVSGAMMLVAIVADLWSDLRAGPRPDTPQ